MTMYSTTKRLTTAASALSLGLMLSGSLAMAADTPAATLSTAPPPAAAYPRWTPEERRQHWEQVQQSARELWAKADLTPQQRQQYWEQMQRGWRDLEAMMNRPAEAPPTAPAMAALAGAATPATVGTYPPARVHSLWALWRMSAEQRQQYWEYMQRGGKG